MKASNTRTLSLSLVGLSIAAITGTAQAQVPEDDMDLTAAGPTTPATAEIMRNPVLKRELINSAVLVDELRRTGRLVIQLDKLGCRLNGMTETTAASPCAGSPVCP